MVEGPMTHNPYKIILCIFSLLFISQLPIFSTNAQQTMSIETSVLPEDSNLLIILSPQYKNDPDILAAIQAYITSVKNDLGWTSTIITIQQSENDYRTIDTIIETNNNNHTIKACLMVGEDLNTALSGDSDYLEQPSTLPWATLGGPSSYAYTDQGIIAKPTTMQLCISLLYPPHQHPYEQKKASLIFAFHKFTTQRHHPMQNTIRVFESSDLNTNSKTIYQTLNTASALHYVEDPSPTEIANALTTPSIAVFVHGHSNPSGTDLTTQKHTGWFSAENLDTLDTPLFGADGCYAAGWWSNQKDNNRLDGNIDATWYGSKIFSSTTIQVMALGLLSQNGFPTPVSFIENAMPDLLSGKTIAEAMIGDTTIGDTILIGDPTFHFTL